MTHTNHTGRHPLPHPLAMLGASLLLIMATHAAAQAPALSRENAQRRRQLTAQAGQLSRAGDHAGALLRAREAAALGSTPALRRTIAEELEALGDVADRKASCRERVSSPV